MSDSISSENGVDFISLLTILFIALKLIGEITWSWVWVLSPLWVSWAFGLLVVLVLLAFGRKTSLKFKL